MAPLGPFGVEARAIVRTVKSNPPDSSHKRTSTRASGACLAAFCSASRQQKYTAASVSDG